jgi:hypothetical protein
MGRAARIGIGAGVVAGLGATFVKLRRVLQDKQSSRRARAAEARRNLWPPVPVKPGAEASIDADQVSRAETAGA